MAARPRLVLVGGFLGAGKTTLILAASRALGRRGIRCAVILNDQGDALVDSGFAREQGLDTDEVTGGCFCCRFSDLLEALDRIAPAGAEVIFAEPVGSCTDIAATVMRPLLSEYSSRFDVAPFTVVVDPGRAAALGDADQRFLFEHQLAEADIVCWTKSDVYPGLEKAGRRVSGRTGEGVEAWLDEVLRGGAAPGERRIDVDYERYAAAEAALAWLNADLRLDAEPELTPAMLVGPLLEEVDRGLTGAGVSIVHLKMLDRTPQGWIKAAVSSNGEEPGVDGDLDASPSREHELLINLRASGDPEVVRPIVESALAHVPAMVRSERIACFRPGAPVPQFRLG